jgi:hypothetical protein
MIFGRYQVRSVLIPRKLHAVHSTHKRIDTAQAAKKRLRLSKLFIYDAFERKRVRA